MPAGVEPGIEHIAETQPLRALVARERGDWLASIIGDNRLHSMFEPRVDSATGRTSSAHEALLRATDQDGAAISPAALFDAARESDMLFHLDRAARVLAIESARSTELSTNLLAASFNRLPSCDPHLRTRPDNHGGHPAGWPARRLGHLRGG
ncbi:MAG: EAL domain-containing protein [Dehalococcoidia bacterium]|nr:EAL domain-containing protein [Dehalococcoidia bacterium]